MGLFWSRSYLSGNKITKENIIEFNDTMVIYSIIEKRIPIIRNLKFDDEIKNKCYEILEKVNESDGFTYIDYYITKIYSISEYNDRYYLYNSSKISPTTYGWTLND